MKRMRTVVLGLLIFSSLRVAALPIQADTSRIDSVQVEAYTNIPSVPEAVLLERLPKLEKTIPLPYHKTVHGFVNHFLFTKPSYTRTMLERMSLFFPLYERMLSKYNLPDELKYLSIVESGLNPRAVSHAGAGGLWQFMPGTGRDMRLYQDDYIDERMEPVKATEAACKYLRDLYNIFHDWPLALAAYNSGPGTVKRAMRRSGGNSFWTIYDFLPKETRAYVPQFIAFTYVINYANDHGIYPETPEYPIPFDTIHVNSYFNVMTFAKQTGIPIGDMHKLNPHVTTGILPTYTRDFMLRVPSDQFTYFEKHRWAIIDSASQMPLIMDHILLADAEGVDTNGLAQTIDNDRFSLARLSAEQPATPAEGILIVSNAPMPTEQSEPDDVEEVVQQKPKAIAFRKPARNRYHRVQPGDTLWNIAQRYDGLSIEQLKKVNRIRGSALKPGQKLIVG